MKKICIVVNSMSFFISHRKDIAIRASEVGYQVYVLAPFDCAIPTNLSNKIKFINIKLHRSALNPVKEIFSFISLYRKISKITPDVLHLVTIKPVLYGGLIARLIKNTNPVFAISGLGSVFTATGFYASIRRLIISYIYRLVLNGNPAVVICQNSSDASVINNIGKIKTFKLELINGSGVDLSEYSPAPMPTLPLTVTMATRLLVEKGVRDFVTAASLACEQGLPIRFILAGTIDRGNPYSITKEELDEWRSINTLSIIGFCENIPSLYADSHVVCLPSYYGEGIPKALIEAAASGRAIITTDTPGCRETVSDNLNGYLVCRESPLEIVLNLKKFLSDSNLIEKFGEQSRYLAESKFDVREVVDRHLEIYYELSNKDV